MLHKKTQDILLSPECPVLPMYLYFIVSYFTFTFTLYVFPVVRSFTVTVAFPFFKPLIVPFEDTFTTFLLDVVNFKISGSKYPFSVFEMYTLVCSFVVCLFLIVTLLVFALIFVILDALYVTAFFARYFNCGSCFVINTAVFYLL